MDRVTAKLLERQGDYQGAFDVLFSRLQRAIQEVEYFVISNIVFFFFCILRD